ncbi:MAG: uroporphyrinogen decarboxylase [Deltaproteobacteria bacterium]|nr:uroporphyrinogen decarboxylase [Deltaproteobacteria bacterium]MBI3294887.1 uroporphyrinogen decarboxylase [Deltaproteobacteria bacterium]
MNPFLRHLAGETIGRFPVWMMRQAGRYLPQYRVIRERHSFWEMVTRPELAAEVSLLPLKTVKVDAVIFFSDILTLPYGQGVPIELVESVGPVLRERFEGPEAFRRFEEFDPSRHTPFVGEAMQSIRGSLSPDIALIGFAGSPWTVASYLVEGKSSKNFAHIKGWAFEDPESLADSLAHLAQATGRYLRAQIEAGAQVVQLFDTWLASAPLSFVRQHYLPLVKALCADLKRFNVPVVYFAKDCPHLLGELAEMAVDVLGVDSSLTLKEAEQLSGGGKSLQGNLDPVALLGKAATVRRMTRELVQEARTLKRPPILNLGHGILPGTPVENAVAFVDEARTLWI